jgi:putative methionine-R-sulfoxide reductase with GAF domain
MIDYKEITEKIRMIISEKKEHTIQDIVNLLYQKVPHYNWVGIYLVKNDMLHLGPWAGPQATEHITIPIGTGICGSAAKTGRIEIIPDVQNDNRYLSCFISTRSEIVVPIINKNIIVGEIDIDSDQQNAFTELDKEFLKNIADMLGSHILMI